MKCVVAYIQNQLLAFALFHAMEGRKKASVELVPQVESCYMYCKSMNPDIFIAEVKDSAPLTLEEWYVRIEEIKQTEKNCKIILIADRENQPKSALQVKEAFKDKKIDLFFYMTSWPDYIADVVTAM